MRRKRKRRDNGTQPQDDAADTQRRVQECQRAIEVALAQFQCVLEPEITIRGTRIETAVRIHPRQP
jgi:hypothetical protein